MHAIGSPNLFRCHWHIFPPASELDIHVPYLLHIVGIHRQPDQKDETCNMVLALTVRALFQPLYIQRRSLRKIAEDLSFHPWLFLLSFACAI